MRSLILSFTLIWTTLVRAQEPRTIHVLVALCDNVHQGIVPVSKSLGNGQDKDSNLYWGAAYGVRTWFGRSKDWERRTTAVVLPEHVLERCVWKHKATGTVLVADAYDGQFIATTTADFLSYAGGHAPSTIDIGNGPLGTGGAADLIAYVGHDGLMDLAAPPAKTPANDKARRTIILACISQRYFREPLRATGASPLLWTTGLMAPEAYTLEAAVNTWIAGGNDAAVREAAAVAYDKWQKCGINGARRLLVTGW